MLFINVEIKVKGTFIPALISFCITTWFLLRLVHTPKRRWITLQTASLPFIIVIIIIQSWSSTLRIGDFLKDWLIFHWCQTPPVVCVRVVWWNICWYNWDDSVETLTPNWSCFPWNHFYLNISHLSVRERERERKIGKGKERLKPTGWKHDCSICFWFSRYARYDIYVLSWATVLYAEPH